MKHGKNIRGYFIAVILFIILVGSVAAPRVPGLPPQAQAWLDQFRIALGLDLQGGLHLEYKLDLHDIDDTQKTAAVEAVQAVIERRVNALGVGEPIVQVAQRGTDRYLIVELPGIRDVQRAKDVIKETPFLEFREERSDEEKTEILKPQIEALAAQNAQKKAIAQDVLRRALSGEDFDALAKEYSEDLGSKDRGGVLDYVARGSFLPEVDQVLFDDAFTDGTIYPELVESSLGWHIIKKLHTRDTNGTQEVQAQHILLQKKQPQYSQDILYKPTALTGKYLDGSVVNFGGRGGAGISAPEVSLQFNDEGAKLFAELTKRNIGKTIAIYVDGEVVSAPVVNTEIVNGQAVISGNFTLDEAKDLAGRLNEGALPVPIELVSQQSVEASLGADALHKSIIAGGIGLLFVAIYMLLYYRLLGLIAAGAITVYAATIIALFKLSSVFGPGGSITLTLAGFAGLILSIGMAVDANILIFERIREELRRGRGLRLAVEEGFHRAWSAIRDGNLSTILTAFILMTMGTGFVKGFAIILILGVLVSMFTAIVLVKIVMHFTFGHWLEKHLWLLCNCRTKK